MRHCFRFLVVIMIGSLLISCTDNLPEVNFLDEISIWEDISLTDIKNSSQEDRFNVFDFLKDIFYNSSVKWKDRNNDNNQNNTVFIYPDCNIEDKHLPCEGQYDTVLASGDGYYLVSKWIENYQEAYTEYGVINSDGTWTIPLSSTNSLAYAADDFGTYSKSYYDLKFDYIGDGMFLIRRQCCLLPERIENGYEQSYNANGSSHVLNAETGKVYNTGWIISPYVDGYAFTRSNYLGDITRIDKNGKTLAFCDTREVYWGLPSHGMIYIDQKFYDIVTGQIKIDLTEYDMASEGNMAFNENGQYSFTIKNPAGTRYSVTIDTTGALVGEPQKLG